MTDIQYPPRKLVSPYIRKMAVADVMTAPDGFIVTVKEPTRTSDQNARMWAMLSEISNQVVWHGRKLSAEDWKHIFTSSLKKMDVVPNLEGNGFVVLGLSTSRMTKRELSDLMELIESFGIEHGIKFADEVMA